MRVATFNVNGIRAAVRRGFTDWLNARDCDIVGLQEVRCPVSELPGEAFEGYHLAYHPGNLPGRNGVAILSRQRPVAIRLGTGDRMFDAEGRYVEVDLPALTVGSLYLPKGGQPGTDTHAKYLRKLRFMRWFRAYLTRARRLAGRAGREFLVMGDFNIAHTPQDLKNWRIHRRDEGFLPDERAWFDSILGPRTLTDAVRAAKPDTQGPYSWWSWRGRSWDNDAGWRIDYQLVTPGLAATILTGGTDKASDYAERMSDHAPVVVDYGAKQASTSAPVTSSMHACCQRGF